MRNCRGMADLKVTEQNSETLKDSLSHHYSLDVWQCQAPSIMLQAVFSVRGVSAVYLKVPKVQT